MNLNVESMASGRSIGEETYFVFYCDHDSGSQSKGFMVREGLDNAERSARLLEEVGYQHVDVRHAISIGELF